MKMLDIGELSRTTGVSASALRYYEEIGLLTSVGRKGLRRQFPPEARLQLALVSMGKAAGFTLEEIAGMFGKSGAPDLPRPLLLRKAEEMDRRIAELAVLRDTLRHVAECPAPSHMECPTFRRMVEVAATRAARGGEGKPRKRKAPRAN